MKHIPLLFIFSVIGLMGGCSESTKTSSSASSAYCSANPYTYGCPGYGATTTGAAGGGVYCQVYPTDPACATAVGTNPNPYYYSAYVDKNWAVQYPTIPSLNCTDATAPAGITYTPYETRKGTVTLKGQVNYDPSSGQAYFDTTSSMLQSVSQARNFFWGDSTLKVRFKSNIQPSSANTTDVCPGRTRGSTIKGYGMIKFDLYLVGKKANGSETTVSLGTKTVNVNSCTPAIDLSSFAAAYPAGIYLKVKNVQGNQNWLPGTYAESQAYDQYGYIYPQNSYVGSTWKLIRNMECWSLDFEVAADGTKTFN